MASSARRPKDAPHDERRVLSDRASRAPDRVSPLHATRDLSVSILGTRGIPARYGGFETFAEALAQHLVARGWDVTVYCQAPVGSAFHADQWRSIRLVHVPSRLRGGFGALVYDLDAVRDAARRPGVALVLGYNTALFGLLLRLRGIRQITNMDGIEWRRPKWPLAVRAWLWVNEWIAARLSDHLVADHPEIERHLRTRTSPDRITMIPYGAERVTDGDRSVLAPLGLALDGYALVVGNSVPDNSILEIVRAFSRRPRPVRLVVVGRYDPDTDGYHRRVVSSASEDVLFPGPIYGAELRSLRVFARLYVHGHTVGGTNPSLVEAMGAGSAVLARDNAYNRWVAGEGAWYFRDEDEGAARFDALLENGPALARLRTASAARHAQLFMHDAVLRRYEALLLRWQHVSRRAEPEPR